jgi:hypothetical protein
MGMKACMVSGCSGDAVSKGLCKRHWHKQRRYGHPGGGASWRRGESLAWLLGHVSHEGDECLVWPFTRSKSGYGVIYIDGRQRPAHREVCERAHGPAPSKRHQAAHSCGRGHEGCVNKRHLRWATPAENQADRVMHGTHSRGTANIRALLTEAQVVDIRNRLAGGSTQAALARDFGVHLSTIHLIKTGRNWGWLKEKTA